MKLLLFSASVLLLLAACATSGRIVEHIPPIETVTVRQLEEKVRSDELVFEALQDISAIGALDGAISREKLDQLYAQALEQLTRQFEQAIYDQHYRTAWKIYSSAVVLGIEDRFPEWNSEKLKLKEAYHYLRKGEEVAALSLFQNLVSTESVTAGTLLDFGEAALRQKNSKIMNEIIRRLPELHTAIPPEYEQMVTETASHAEMLEGTVTIWVNKGLKIERGVGYPDRVIGSGFFIDRRGYILTNYHVIESEVDPEYEGYSRLYIRMSDSAVDRYPARVVGFDRIFDIALLKVEIEAPFIFHLEDQEDFRPGEKIFAMGSPAGLENTITSGIVSAVGRRFLQMGDTMQVDVPINPGNSGGPLLNEKGEIVGIVFAGIEQFEGINFAIPGHWINAILPALYRGNEVIHPWLGLSLYENEKQLEIVYSIPGEPGERGGLTSGDIITEVNGTTYTTIRDIQKFLLTREPGSLIRINWKRNGEEKTGLFSLSERPFHPIDVALKRDVRDNLILPLFGMEVEGFKKTIIDKNYSVKKVYKGSVADETGISVNDPLTIRDWIIDEDERIVALQIFIKKRTAGFMESIVQLAAYLESDTYI